MQTRFQKNFSPGRSGGGRICRFPISKTLWLTGKKGDCINDNPPSVDPKGDYHCTGVFICSHRTFFALPGLS